LRLKLLFALTLAALSARAQMPRRDPSLFITLRESGRLTARLYLETPISRPLAAAFAQAMGCPPEPVPVPDPRIGSLEIECPSAQRRHGLWASASWDFAALNAELTRAGARRIEVSITHPRFGSAILRPAGFSENGWGVTVSHRGTLRLDDFHQVTFSTGIDRGQIWFLAVAAGVVLLMPLLLLPARTAGPLYTVAASHGLFCLAATAWLSATLPLNMIAIAALPWNLAMAATPLLVAVWIASRIIGGHRQRLFFWRGVRGVAFVLLALGMFSGTDSMVPWLLCCVAIVLVSLWRQRGAMGHRLDALGEGDLLGRVRQLADRAAAPVKRIRVLEGGEDLPAAFASRRHGIIVTTGLLRSVTRREVDAIVCHELSHIRRPPFAIGRKGGPVLVGAILVAWTVPAALVWMPLLIPFGFLFYRALRRKNERTADTDALLWSGDAEALITGLVRVTLASKIPLDWPRWLKPLLPHPSTMERVRAVAGRAKIPAARFEQLLSPAEVLPGDCYTIPQRPVATGSVFSAEARKRLNIKLSLVALAIPVVCGLAAPFTGYIAALAAGALGTVLISEWVLGRTRMRARAALVGRPGVFAGFSPSVEPRIYEGSYDYDVGFCAFEADRMAFRGARGNWSFTRDQVEGVWAAGGPFGWFPRPVVCFRLRSGPSFCLRPFDRAFGFAAPRAASRLLDQATRWRLSADEAQPSSAAAAFPNFDFKAPAGDPPPRYSWQTFLRSFPRYGCVTLALNWLILLGSSSPNWTDPVRLLGPVAVTFGIAIFLFYPQVRRSRDLKPPHAVAVEQGP